MKKQTAWVKNTCSSKPAVADSFVVIFQKVRYINHSLQLTVDRKDYEFFADTFPCKRRPLKLKREIAKVIVRVMNHGDQIGMRTGEENSVCSSQAAVACTLSRGQKKAPDKKSSPGFPPSKQISDDNECPHVLIKHHPCKLLSHGRNEFLIPIENISV